MGSIFRASNNPNGRGFPEEVIVADFDIIIRHMDPTSAQIPRKGKDGWRVPPLEPKPRRASTWSDEEDNIPSNAFHANTWDEGGSEFLADNRSSALALSVPTQFYGSNSVTETSGAFLERSFQPTNQILVRY